MKYIITGSRVYGGNTEKSDLDIVLLQKDSGKLADWLIEKGIKMITIGNPIGNLVKESGTYYFSILDIKINIIEVLNKKEFKTWEDSTEKMRGFPSIENKDERIEFFTSIFDKEK